VLATRGEGKPSAARRAFLLYLLSLNLWTAGTLVTWLLLVGPAPTLAWLGVVAMPLGCYLFAQAHQAWRLPRSAYSALLGGLVALGLAQYLAVLRGLGPGGRGPAPALSLLTLVYGLSLLGLGTWLWFRAWYPVPIGRRRVLRKLVMGLAIVVLTAALYLSPRQSYGPELALAAISMALAALVIFRRRLPPLPVPQRRSAGYALLSLLGVALCAVLAYGAHTLAGLLGVLLILAVGFILSGLILAFPEMADTLSAWVERTIFRSQYEARRMVEEVAEAAPAVLDLEPLVAMILERTMRSLDIRWGLFALWDRISRELRAVIARGGPEGVGAAVWPSDHPLTRWLLEGSSEAQVDALPDTQPPLDLPPLDAAWLVPVRLREEVVGVFLYGPHTSGEPYSTTECSILNLLANETAAAVANARLFNQVARARREWLQTFDALSDGVFIHDRQGRILRANRALARLVDRPFDEILYQPWFELIPAGPEPRQACSTHRRAVREGEASEYDLGYGNRRTLHVTVSSLAEGDEFCVHVVRDVTEERALQRQLAQAEKLAAIGEMLSGVAHELNNPLTTIIGFSELLQDAGLPEEVRADLQRIFRQAQHSSRIVQGLLTFARQSRSQLAAVNVNSVLTQTLEFMQPRLESHHIQVHLDLDARLPHTLADAGQLQQVFLNLCGNAVHAMAQQKDGGTLYLRTEATASDIRITVRDDGPGIAPELLQRVFDPFYTTRTVGEGTGLGLSICYGIVREHGGRIWAESEPGEGATFYVELPIRHAAARPASPPAHSPPRGRRLLVVEDEEGIVALLCRVLESAGHEVLTAGDGERGLELLTDAVARGQPPDLIVADLKMPRLDGQGFYERVCRDHPELARRFLFITGDTIRPETHRFLDACGLPYLRKPFDIHEIDEAVAVALPEVQGDE
jgi:two-component system NtrC family sensor kinase